MFDSTRPTAIPADAQAVAGYVDGPYAWRPEHWARFAGHKITISVTGETNARVYDVEPRRIWPVSAVIPYVQRARAAGIQRVTVYCNLSHLAEAQAAFRNAGVPLPDFWVARYDGRPEIPAGTIGKQYLSPDGDTKPPGHYDVSYVDENWAAGRQGGNPMSDMRILVNALREAGVTVHEYAGADGRTMDRDVPNITIRGGIVHHTATPFNWNISGLVSSTRADMRGATLANLSGNPDGSITYLASGVAWHAGSGSGPSLGPLAPYAARMNYYTVGLEIVYPGDSPMTNAQYRSAQVFAKVVAETFGGGNIETVRAHAETNGTQDGKWDPGYAPGRTINMTEFRRGAAALSMTGEGFMAGLDPALQQQIYDAIADTFVTTGGKTLGQAVGRIDNFLTAIEQGAGIDPAAVFVQIYDVIAANYVENKEAIGKTTADTERKVDEVAKKLDQLIAALAPKQ